MSSSCSSLLVRFDGAAAPASDGAPPSSGAAARFYRCDFVQPLTKPTRTAQGFLRIAGNLTRVGVLTYKTADGQTRKELREPQEVFDAASLATLAGAPVTDLHIDMISPANVKGLAVGFVGENVEHDSAFVKGVLTIQDKNIIEAVERGDRRELSPGYTCLLDETPGEYKGERYDAIQRSIVYNHLAIGPKNWGRSGPEVSLRMDGAAYECDADEDKTKPIKRGCEMKKVRVTLDGIVYEVEIAEPLAANFEGALAKIQTERKDAADKVAKLEGEAVANKKALDEAEARAREAIAPERMDAAVNERVALIESARKLSPEIKTDGKDTNTIKIEALCEHGYKAEDFAGKDSAFVDGVFSATARAVKTDADTDGGARSVGADAKPRTDDKEKRIDSDAARQKMIENNRKMWESKLDANK